jgi:hypothetical protein
MIHDLDLKVHHLDVDSRFVCIRPYLLRKAIILQGMQRILAVKCSHALEALL